MPGLLAQGNLQNVLNSPQMQGIAQGLLAASGPSTQPISLGQALQQGMQYGNQMQQQQRANQLQDLEVMMKLSEIKRKQQEQEMLQQLLGGGSTQAQGGGNTNTGSPNPDDIAKAAVLTGNSALGNYADYLNKNTPQWESVNDPMFGKGMRNKRTGEFNPVKTDVQDPEKAQAVKQETLTVIDRLLNNPSGVRANRGGISTLFPNVSDSAVNAEGDLETLASLLTTENLGLLKGVLSDTDMKILKDIGAGGLKGADKQVLGNLRKMRNALVGELSGNSGGGVPQGWTVRQK